MTSLTNFGARLLPSSPMERGSAVALPETTDAFSTLLRGSCVRVRLGEISLQIMETGTVFSSDSEGLQKQAFGKSWPQASRTAQTWNGSCSTPATSRYTSMACKVQRDYDKYLYKLRHLVENYFQKAKRWRGLATRYVKTTLSFSSYFHIFNTLMWAKVV